MASLSVLKTYDIRGDLGTELNKDIACLLGALMPLLHLSLPGHAQLEYPAWRSVHLGKLGLPCYFKE